MSRYQLSDIDYPHRQHERVKNQAIQLMQAAANPLMPKAMCAVQGVECSGTELSLAVADESSVSTPYNRYTNNSSAPILIPQNAMFCLFPGLQNIALNPLNRAINICILQVIGRIITILDRLKAQ